MTDRLLARLMQQMRARSVNLWRGLVGGAEISRNQPRHGRASILESAAQIVESRRDTFVKTIVRESGKTINQARKEVLRCVNTLKLSAEEAKRNAGEIVPFDAYAGS
ncbi:MAG: aldehyde dehydrogenase family protein, partial [Mesorhizobium sp.]